jgi:hypothetical protein
VGDPRGPDPARRLNPRAGGGQGRRAIATTSTKRGWRTRNDLPAGLRPACCVYCPCRAGRRAMATTSTKRGWRTRNDLRVRPSALQGGAEPKKNTEPGSRRARKRQGPADDTSLERLAAPCVAIRSLLDIAWSDRTSRRIVASFFLTQLDTQCCRLLLHNPAPSSMRLVAPSPSTLNRPGLLAIGDEIRESSSIRSGLRSLPSAPPASTSQDADARRQQPDPGTADRRCG